MVILPGKIRGKRILLEGFDSLVYRPINDFATLSFVPEQNNSGGRDNELYLDQDCWEWYLVFILLGLF